MTWRGYSNPDDDILPLRAGLDQLAKRIGVSSPGAMAKIEAAWVDAVGSQVADHTRPVSIKKTTLVVEVDDKRWATQLKWITGKIVANLAEKVPEASIEAVEVRQAGR